MTNVIVVIGAGSIGQAIARRVSAGKHVLLADLRQENADAAAKVLGDAGFDVSTANYWSATPQQLYRELERLEGEGLLDARVVEQQRRPNKRVFTLTDAGRAEVRR